MVRPVAGLFVVAAFVLAFHSQPSTQEDRDSFAYWDANGNGDLTCSEALRDGGPDGLKLPAYQDDRDGTGLIYEWLQRVRESDTDDDGIACDSSNNPDGYVPQEETEPEVTERGCPDVAETWMGLRVCEESGDRTGYDRDAFGSGYTDTEAEIIADLPQMGEQVYTPYTCKLFDIEPDGTAATDIEHIVALAEAFDSGLPEQQQRVFAGDLDNLTIADPSVNRAKSDLDAGSWQPALNQGWFASRVIEVKLEYSLAVNPRERDELERMLSTDPSRDVTCGTSVPALPFLDGLLDRLLR